MIPHVLQLPCSKGHPNFDFREWLLGYNGSGEEVRGYEYHCSCGEHRMLQLTEAELRRQNQTDGDEAVEYTEYSLVSAGPAVAPRHEHEHDSGVVLGAVVFSPEDDAWLRQFKRSGR